MLSNLNNGKLIKFLVDDTLKLSRRLISSEEHIEVASDLIDQGVFMMRSDVAHWIMTNTEDRDSIRASLIPSLLKRQYSGKFV